MTAMSTMRRVARVRRMLERGRREEATTPRQDGRQKWRGDSRVGKAVASPYAGMQIGVTSQKRSSPVSDLRLVTKNRFFGAIL